MTTEERKKAWKELEEETIVKEDTKKCSSEQDKVKTKGLSIAIDNIVLEGYTKPKEEEGKGFKIKQLGRLFSICISNQIGMLNGYVPYEVVALTLGLAMTKTSKNDKNKFNLQIRKALKELYPTIEFKEDLEKGIKFTHIPTGSNFGMYIEKGETKGFTQLFCDLNLVEEISLDLVVVHTVLEYFKGSNKETNPSLDTIAKRCGCSRRKVVELLKEGHELALWDIETTNGGSKVNTNKYHLSYITENGDERYHYLDAIEKEQTMDRVIEHDDNECTIGWY